MRKRVRDRQEVCDTKCEQQGELRTEHSRKNNNQKKPQRQKETETDSEMVRGRQMHKDRKSDKEKWGASFRVGGGTGEEQAGGL